MNSDKSYVRPSDVEGGTIVRLVRLSDPVTSPVARTFRNSVLGVRGTEKWDYVGLGLCATCLVASLGFWQLERMKWKKNLIELRTERLSGPIIRDVRGSPLPWAGKVREHVYRVVELHGTFDHKYTQFVGPRAVPNHATGDSQKGYLVITPLRLEDGSSVLINRGHLEKDQAQMVRDAVFQMYYDRSFLRSAKRRFIGEVPVPVTVRGVIETGEI